MPPIKDHKETLLVDGYKIDTTALVGEDAEATRMIEGL